MVDGSWDTPGDLHEQLLGIGIEDVFVDTDFFESFAYVLRAKLRWPCCQFQAKAHAREQGTVDSHVQSWHQRSIAAEQHAERRLGIKAVAGQQPQLFERHGREVLRFFEDQHRPESVEITPELA